MAKILINPSNSYFLLLLVLSNNFAIFNLGEASVMRRLPAIFIFGDSTADVGTNNYLPSPFAKANFPYNGIDFPNSAPTGRFTNGYNLGDQIAMLFGFKESPPAFLYILNKTSIDLKKKIQRGVNFASGGAGLLYETGLSQLKAVVPVEEQIQQFAMVRENITEVKGPVETAKILSKALYIFSIGANDILHYFHANSSLTKEQFLVNLQSTFHDHLKNLYNMGARKFGIIGVPPMGCCPYARAYNQKGGNDGCVEIVNDIAYAFYNLTQNLLQRMSSELPEIKYSIGNTYDMAINIINNYPSFGFKEIKWACCGNGNYNGEFPCYKPSGPNLCQNRSEYLFWDSYHPSQATYELIAAFLYGGDTKYMTPMNFSQLAEVKLHEL